MKRKLLSLLVAILCLAMTHTIHAQQTQSPLLILISDTEGYGDLWAWTSTDKPLQQLTNWRYNFTPVLSPDGKQVAYRSIPQFAIPPRCSGWPPFNIWVLNIATGNAIRIADQPPDGAYCDSAAAKWIARPKPAWSPDSKQLAWGESPVPQPEDSSLVMYRLVTYDLVKRRQRIIVPDLPGYQGISSGQQVDWGAGGILNAANLTPVEANLMSASIYNLDGNQIFSKGIGENPCTLVGIESLWVQDDDKAVVAVCNENQLYLLDPTTGELSEFFGQLELYNPTVPDGLSVFATVSQDGAATWHLAKQEQVIKELAATQTRYYLDDDAIDSLAISPDGQQVAYLSDEGLFIYDQNAEATPIEVELKEGERIAWIGWGPTAWRTHRE